MKTAFLTASALAAMIVAAAAQTSPPAAVTVTDAWARATSPVAKTGAAYMTVTGNAVPDHLIGASTPVAATAGVHQTTEANGVMQMRPVAALALDAGKAVVFRPGGYHVMLIDLKHPLHQGDSFPLTLVFEHAQPVTIQVKVAGPGASQPMPAMDMSGMHKP